MASISFFGKHSQRLGSYQNEGKLYIAVDFTACQDDF